MAFFLLNEYSLNKNLAGILNEKKANEDDEDDYDESTRKTVRSSVDPDSDSD